MTCLPYNPFLKLLRASTREVLGFMRRGHLEAVLPRENAGMDGADCHVTADRQIHAVLCKRKNTIKTDKRIKCSKWQVSQVKIILFLVGPDLNSRGNKCQFWQVIVEALEEFPNYSIQSKN